ncbi:hypothetical protein [Nostoc sp. NMS4]|uniref:hypothetical protein n=1 Tax=Nostoc sp. NMS4 TaxID=2815390 RepID=UPI0025EAD689|nr:hypothetical protein [Nostoc sp. NMS4]MBN3926305.1 hypothetical protein [Nostoc sp. NMS4]
MFSTVAKFSLFTFLYFYSVSLQTRLGAIVTTWLQILWCRSYARRRHRALHKNLKPESNAHKQDPRLLREVGDLRVAILTNQIGLL